MSLRLISVATLKMKQNQDTLRKLFELREEFMTAICEHVPEAYPEWPVDFSNKKNQQALRETAFRSMEELFEALLHLKNWKSHREGTVEFDRSEFLEEMIDAFNYYLAILVMAGVDSKEFMQAFKDKHDIIMGRLVKEL